MSAHHSSEMLYDDSVPTSKFGLDRAFAAIDSLAARLVEVLRGPGPDLNGDEELPIECGERYAPVLRVSEPVSPARSPDSVERCVLADGLLGPDGQPLRVGEAHTHQLLTDSRELSAQLVRHLQRHPDELQRLHHRDFEKVLAELFSSRGYEVHLTSATRDGGYDLCLATKTELGSVLYLVEAKRWRRLVGIPVVRALYGEVEHHRATAGLVVTTSDFTRDARRLAEKIKFRISLHNYEVLQEWLAEFRPVLPMPTSAAAREDALKEAVRRRNAALRAAADLVRRSHNSLYIMIGRDPDVVLLVETYRSKPVDSETELEMSAVLAAYGMTHRVMRYAARARPAPLRRTAL
ncbi:MAG: restriction endonuclease [Actinomycetes bacterium]